MNKTKFLVALCVCFSVFFFLLGALFTKAFMPNLIEFGSRKFDKQTAVVTRYMLNLYCDSRWTQILREEERGRFPDPVHITDRECVDSYREGRNPIRHAVIANKNFKDLIQRSDETVGDVPLAIALLPHDDNGEDFKIIAYCKSGFRAIKGRELTAVLTNHFGFTYRKSRDDWYSVYREIRDAEQGGREKTRGVRQNSAELIR